MTPNQHAILSPSAAHRWLNCTPSAQLEATLPESIKPYAEEGRLAHSVCELVARNKFFPMKKKEYNDALKKLKTDAFWQDEMLTTANIYMEHLEAFYLGFRHKPLMALEMRVDISDYAPEAFGTCDCLMIGEHKRIIVDYKHGTGLPVSAIDNPQLKLYALGTLKTYRFIYGSTINHVTMCIVQPRRNIFDCWGLPVDELYAWGEMIKPKAAAAFAGTGEFNPGEWCHFCRANVQCRARADAHTALEDFKDLALPGKPNEEGKALLTYAEIGDVLTRGKTLVEWYNDLKEYAETACRNGQIIPGWKMVHGRSDRKWSDQDKALEIILNAGHPRELVYDTKPKTLAQLEKLIGAKPFNALVADLIIKPPGAPTFVEESDKRPPYSSAAADFAEMKA